MTIWHLALSPVRSDRRVSYAVAGDTLLVDGEPVDLAPLPEGGSLPREAVDADWCGGRVERRAGALHLTLMLPHGPDAPEATLFPQPVTMLGDGPVPLPPWGGAPHVGEEIEPSDAEPGPVVLAEPATPAEEA